MPKKREPREVLEAIQRTLERDMNTYKEYIVSKKGVLERLKVTYKDDPKNICLGSCREDLKDYREALRELKEEIALLKSIKELYFKD